ncbi:MAG TPA: TonB-dependent receptor [Pseudoxanthomonas sp.]
MPRTSTSRRFAPAPRAALFLALSAALALPVQAQEAPADASDATELDRITVTAQKREQQIQEVPISINAYSGDFLQANGINDYGDLGTLVPGLEVQTQSVSNPSISIRGITADLDDPTQEPRISLFQDGVSISRARGSSVEMFDMERVEVLRGPQGTLFGRAAETGALHLIQNKAREGISSGFQLGAGSDEQLKFTGFHNTDLSESLKGRVAVFYESRDGYMENLDGGTLQGKDTRAIRGALHLNVGEASGLDLIMNYQKDQPPGTGFRSQVIPNMRGSLDPYVANSQRGEALGTDREVYGTTLLGNFSINDNWSLSIITGWRGFDGIDKFDSDGSQADLIEFDEHARGEQFSQEFRFNFDNGGAFTGFAGASFFSETAKRDLTFQADERQLYALLSPQANAVFPFLPIVPLLNPDFTPNTSVESLVGGLFPLNPDHRETFGNDVDLRSFELFADGTWRFTDRWELTLGLRGTHESATYGYHSDPGTFSSLGKLFSGRSDPLTGQPMAACPSLFGDCFNLLFPATNGRLSSDGSWNSWVGRAVLGYSFNDNLNAYASLARGRRPSMIEISDVADKEIPAEILTSYELGLKGATADGRFTYDLSLFYYDYTDFQASVQNPVPPPFFRTISARARALGFEASLFGRFNDRIGGFLNYGYIDAGFNAFNEDGTYQQELAGNRFRMTPENSVSIGLDWNLPLSSGWSLFARPSYSWRSHVYFSDDNEQGIEQDGYGLFNLRAGARLEDRWEIAVWGNNLADKKYLIDAGNTGQLFGIPTVIPGAPRMFGVTLNAKF